MSQYSNEETTMPVIAETLLSKEKGDETNEVNLENITTKLHGTEVSTGFNPIERIREGFNYFKTNEFDKYPDYYRQLANKQEPKFLVVACSDSRVCPTNILNFRPGEAFVTRNIANMVPAFNQLRYSGVGAVIEYAVVALQVEIIMVIGHSRCGGINRLMSLPEKTTSYDFIDDWVKIGLPAKAKVLAHHPNPPPPDSETLQMYCEKEAVKLSLMNLLSYPYVRDGVTDKKIQLMGVYYDFVQGTFEIHGMDLDFTFYPTIHI